MGTSTDAVLFFGYHLPEEVEVPESAYSVGYATGPVQVDDHCSQECTMPYVFWAASRITAARGYPAPVAPADLTVDTTTAGREIIAFAKEHGIPGPGEVVDGIAVVKASDLGWWLLSWWG
jgi:hypothetical protein